MDFEIALDRVLLLCRLAFINRDRCTERNSWLLDNLSALAASLTEKLRHNVFSHRRAVTQSLGHGRALLVLEPFLTWPRWSRGCIQPQDLLQ